METVNVSTLWSPTVTIKDLFALVIDLKFDLSLASRESYKFTGIALVKHFGDVPVASITEIDLLRWIQKLLQHRQPSGINHNIRICRSVGRYAIRKRILPETALATIDLLKTIRKPIRYLTQEEFARIFNAEKNVRMKEIYLFAVLTGIRLSNLLALRWSNVDIERKVFSITNTKGNRPQNIPIHPVLMERILQRTERPPNQFIFGRLFSSAYVSKEFHDAALDAKVPDASFHTLRKTFASLLCVSGVDIYAISSLLGHSSIELTMRTYASIAGRNLQGEVGQLNIMAHLLSQSASFNPK